MQWWQVDFLIMLAYGLQHSLLTTKTAVKIYNKILPDYSWNITYSIFSVITLIVGFNLWQKSGVYIFHVIPGSVGYHVFLVGLSLSLFLFFYCFKYTTSFWQWLGAKQVTMRLMNRPMPPYYRIRQQGIKRYIRFPHHTCLIFFFWLHPVMTLDTLFLSVGATIYLYLGTMHQDRRGLRLIGEEWQEYRKNTCLLLPTPTIYKKMFLDLIHKLKKQS
jgi:hypothetical protein